MFVEGKWLYNYIVANIYENKNFNLFEFNPLKMDKVQHKDKDGNDGSGDPFGNSGHNVIPRYVAQGQPEDQERDHGQDRYLWWKTEANYATPQDDQHNQ